jgi:hypothetical protein
MACILFRRPATRYIRESREEENTARDTAVERYACALFHHAVPLYERIKKKSLKGNLQKAVFLCMAVVV